ncbi:hypothetical protein PENTCL1PPCAC_4315, partial [Pristionchus entomophagus]
PGFAGARCQIKEKNALEQSLETPCDNAISCNGNGVCSGTLEASSCLCLSGFIGARCQISVKGALKQSLADAPCDNKVACSGHGVCSGTASDYECTCLPGFMGARCQWMGC